MSVRGEWREANYETKDIEHVSVDTSAFSHASVYRAINAGTFSKKNHTKMH